MSNKYKIRMYESGNQDGGTTQGTVMLPVDRCFNVLAVSGEEAENIVRRDVQKGKLPLGRVYQVCPASGSSEPILALAAALDGNLERVSLDPASGLYAEFRRIRYPRSEFAAFTEPTASLAVIPA
jgi:hypothetical protein